MSSQKNSVNFRSKLKPLYILLGTLLVLLLLAKLITLGLALNSPMGVKNNANFNWDGSSLNIVFVDTGADAQSTQSLVNFSPSQQKITILDISPQTYLELPKGYGAWKVGSVYKLGQEEMPAVGSKLLEQTVSKLVGLPIDGVIVFKKNDAGKSTEQLIGDLRRNRLGVLGLLTSSESDLTPLQAVKLFWAISSVRSDKVIALDFLQSNVTESKLLADSTRVLGVNSVKLDLFIRKNLADATILEEGKSVAIFNATSHPGLTAQIARIVTNMGGSVITSANAANPLQISQVTFSQNSLTAKRLAQIYAPKCLPKGCVSSDSEVKDSRAEINIILGEDYYKNWFEK